MNKSILIISCVSKKTFARDIAKQGIFCGDVFNNRCYDRLDKKKTYFLVRKSGSYYIADPKNIDMPL